MGETLKFPIVVFLVTKVIQAHYITFRKRKISGSNNLTLIFAEHNVPVTVLNALDRLTHLSHTTPCGSRKI